MADITEIILNGTTYALSSGGSGTELTPELKAALDQIAQKMAYVDDNGSDYYNALHLALYPPANLVSISAVYTQSGTVYNTDTLDSLKSDLVVTAHFNNNTTETVTNYTLSGSLSQSTSTITVSYGGKTTTFTVNVTVKKSDMTQWTDGIAYTDLTVVEGESVNPATGGGGFMTAAGWSRTGYVPCEGATSITFPAISNWGDANASRNWFYDSSYSPISGGKFYLLRDRAATINVPSSASYFAVSLYPQILTDLIADGIVPNA